MKFVVTPKEMKEYDNNAITKIGIPAMVLMERAALSMRDAIRKLQLHGNTALIVSGVGNNGADGLALARLLSEDGFEVTVCMIGKTEKMTTECCLQKSILMHYPVTFLEGEEAEKTIHFLADTHAGFTVLVDALFGVGLNRALEGTFAEVLQCMNHITAYKIAADIPSGISGDSGKVLGIAFQADLTITFAFIKRGLLLYPGSDYAGQLKVADIGMNRQSFCGEEPGLFCYDESPEQLMPVRNPAGNKGTFGKVLLIAGWEQMAGAAILCAKAALRMGAGMVKVICPKENRAILQTAVPEVLYGTMEDITESLKWADVVAAGPGLGRSKRAEDVLKDILENASLPLVLDADALNIIRANKLLEELLFRYAAPKIMTPHMGEWAGLTNKSIAELKEDIFCNAVESAHKYNAVMVCKDARTVIADRDGTICVNVSGNNGMATAGSGDVLTGMIAGLLAQNKDAFRSASVGVYLHGLAGDKARDIYTEYGVTAGRIVENIAEM